MYRITKINDRYYAEQKILWFFWREIDYGNRTIKGAEESIRIWKSLQDSKANRVVVKVYEND